MNEFLASILTILVVAVAVPLNWYVSLLLWRAANADPEGAAIRVAAVFSTSVAILVTVFALVFVNNGMVRPVLLTVETMLLTRGSLLVLSVIPAAYWLRWYLGRNGH